MLKAANIDQPLSTNGNNQVFLSCPVMTFEKFSEVTGMRVGQIKTQVQLGNLPGKKIGRLQLVNSAKLLDKHTAVSPVPVMTYERFAEASGLRENQVASQAERDNLPTRYIGRLRLIDVAALTAICIQPE